MAIPKGITAFDSGHETVADLTRVPPKKYTLAAFSSVDGLKDPNDVTKDITARALATKVTGTVTTVDPYGNTVTEPIEVGKPLLGMVNGITGGTTLVATDIIVYL